MRDHQYYPRTSYVDCDNTDPHIDASLRTDTNSVIQESNNPTNSDNNKTIIIGIPFVFRKINGAGFLILTLTAIINGIPLHQRNLVQIIVLNGELNFVRHYHLYHHLNSVFPSELSSKLITIYSVKVSEYPYAIIYDPCLLRPPPDYTLEKARLLAKGTWDATMLMKIAMNKGKYYLHLEDDTPPHNNWFNIMLDYVAQVESCSSTVATSHKPMMTTTTTDIVCEGKEWWAISFNGKGEIHSRYGGTFGLLFQTSYLPDMVSVIQSRYDQLSMDWQVGEYGENLARRFFVYPQQIVDDGKGTNEEGPDKPLKLSDYDEIMTWKQCE